MPATIEITAVIASKDRPQWAERLVEQLRGQAYRQEALAIIVIDDGSDSVYHFEDKMAVTIIRHAIPRGAQASRNEGINRAKGAFLLMLDDDIELVEKDFLARMENILKGDASLGAVFARKIDVLHSAAGTVREQAFALPRLTWYSGEMKPTEKPQAGYVEWGNQVFLARKEVLGQIEGYDGIYGLNGGHSFREESDLHARIRRAGYRLWYEPGLTIKHHVLNAGGHGGDVGRRLYWIGHNHIIFLRRHTSWWPLKAAGFLWDVGRYSWVQSRGKKTWTMLKGYAAGWKNALRDKYPQANPWLEER